MAVVYYGAGGEQPSWSSRWWTEKASELHKHVFGYAEAIRKDQSARRLQLLQFARLYQNQDPFGFFDGLASTALSQNLSNYLATYNIIKSAVDTATSKIGKSRPRPMILTEGGNWKQRRQADKLTQFLDGSFDYLQLYRKGAQVFRDGGIFGTGALKFYIHNDELCVERILVDELVVDDTEAVYGKPRQMGHTMYVSRDVLKAAYPDKAKDLADTPKAFPDQPGTSHSNDMVKVIEMWHLPSGPEADDGRHVIAVSNVTLYEGEWTKQYFPIVTWRWSERVAGYWGLGIAEELLGTQMELNKLLRNVELAQRLIAVPRIFIQAGSAISQASMNNTIGGVYKYTGTPPMFQTPQAMSGEIYEHIRWLIQSGYEKIGISQMSATSQKPAGLESAVAMREYNDIESERFMVVGQRWEEFYLDCAKIVIDMTRDLVKSGGKARAKVVSDNFMKTIDWKDADMSDEKYVMRMFPANLLPTQPSGRMAKVQELIQAGMIPPDWGMKLLDFPDLKQYTSAVMSSKDLTEKIIYSILENGSYIPPEPQMNLDEALSMSQQAYIQAKLDDAPEERLELLQRFQEAIKAMQPAQPLPINPMAPQANPEAAPTSDLISNVPQ